MEKKIGEIIEERLRAQNVNITKFAKALHTKRENVYSIFKRESYWSRHIVSPRGLFSELKDKNVCFYSLKGTGITNMLENSVPSVVVQRQARHRHLTTTEIYTQTKQIRTSEELTDYR